MKTLKMNFLCLKCSQFNTLQRRYIRQKLIKETELILKIMILKTLIKLKTTKHQNIKSLKMKNFMISIKQMKLLKSLMKMMILIQKHPLLKEEDEEIQCQELSLRMKLRKRN